PIARASGPALSSISRRCFRGRFSYCATRARTEASCMLRRIIEREILTEFFLFTSLILLVEFPRAWDTRHCARRCDRLRATPPGNEPLTKVLLRHCRAVRRFLLASQSAGPSIGLPLAGDQDHRETTDSNRPCRGWLSSK